MNEASDEISNKKRKVAESSQSTSGSTVPALQKENAALKAQIESLQKENAELKADQQDAVQHALEISSKNEERLVKLLEKLSDKVDNKDTIQEILRILTVSPHLVWKNQRWPERCESDSQVESLYDYMIRIHLSQDFGLVGENIVEILHLIPSDKIDLKELYDAFYFWYRPCEFDLCIVRDLVQRLIQFNKVPKCLEFDGEDFPLDMDCAKEIAPLLPHVRGLELVRCYASEDEYVYLLRRFEESATEIDFLKIGFQPDFTDETLEEIASLVNKILQKSYWPLKSLHLVHYEVLGDFGIISKLEFRSNADVLILENFKIHRSFLRNSHLPKKVVLRNCVLGEEVGEADGEEESGTNNFFAGVKQLVLQGGSYRSWFLTEISNVASIRSLDMQGHELTFNRTVADISMMLISILIYDTLQTLLLHESIVLEVTYDDLLPERKLRSLLQKNTSLERVEGGCPAILQSPLFQKVVYCAVLNRCGKRTAREAGTTRLQMVELLKNAMNLENVVEDDRYLEFLNRDSLVYDLLRQCPANWIK